KICDLEGEELRDARLEFATTALSLRKPLTSLSKLSPTQLGRILDEMRRHERAPALPGMPAVRTGSGSDRVEESAEIVHLATGAQVQAIEKLRKYLGWSAIGLNAFIGDKFKGRTVNFLTPAEANSCQMILFTIAARKRIKDRGFKGKISRSLTQAEIPALKRELGIDRKKVTTKDIDDDYQKAVSGAAWEAAPREEPNAE